MTNDLCQGCLLIALPSKTGLAMDNCCLKFVVLGAAPRRQGAYQHSVGRAHGTAPATLDMLGCRSQLLQSFLWLCSYSTVAEWHQ